MDLHVGQVNVATELLNCKIDQYFFVQSTYNLLYFQLASKIWKHHTCSYVLEKESLLLHEKLKNIWLAQWVWTAWAYNVSMLIKHDGDENMSTIIDYIGDLLSISSRRKQVEEDIEYVLAEFGSIEEALNLYLSAHIVIENETMEVSQPLTSMKYWG